MITLYQASNDAKKKGDTTSVSPMKQLPVRANSVGNLSQRDRIVSLKRDNEQTSRTFGPNFEYKNMLSESNIVRNQRAKYREETIRFELQRLQSREEFTRQLAASRFSKSKIDLTRLGQVTDIIKQAEPVDLSSKPNIFDTKEIGKIVKLGIHRFISTKNLLFIIVDSLPPKVLSMNNVSMPAATPLSHSSNFSRKSNNYMDALYTMIQSSPQETSDFQKVSFIPEQVILYTLSQLTHIYLDSEV